MVHPYYSNYPNYYYEIGHHIVSRCILFVISVVLIVLAICDYSIVHQTWFTNTINAIIIIAGVCGILSCIFVSFSLLEFTFLLFMISFALQVASLIYRAIASVPVNSWGYGIALAILLFAAIFATLHLIRWFHAEIVGGKYDLPGGATGGGATTNVAITNPSSQPAQQPMMQQQPMVQQPVYQQPMAQQPMGLSTSSTTTTAGGPSGTTSLGGAPNTTYGADPVLGPGPVGPGPVGGPRPYPSSVLV